MKCWLMGFLLALPMAVNGHVVDLMIEEPGVKIVAEANLKGVSPEMLDWWWDNITPQTFTQLHPTQNVSFEWLVAPGSPQHLGASPGARQQIRQVIGGYEVQQQITWLNETRGVGAEDNTLFADIQFAELGAEQSGRIRYDFNANSMGDGTLVRVVYLLPHALVAAKPGIELAWQAHLETELSNLPLFLADQFQQQFIEGELLTRGHYEIEQTGWLLKTVVVDQEILGITPDMLSWWWDNIGTTQRYKRWHPTAHLRFEWLQPPTNPNDLAYSVGAVQLVTETIGPYKSNLLITWLDPQLVAQEIEYTHWVYAKTDLKELKGILPQRMHHQYQFNAAGDGIVMRSTFTVPAFFDFIMPKFTQRLAEHAQQEMQFLSYFLPQLFELEYAPQ